VVIVAAGRGARLGAAVPKQFLDLGGRSVLQHSVATFIAHPDIRETVVVLPAESVAHGPALAGGVAGAVRFVAGGDRRQDSVRLGVAGLSTDVDVILIHDAARPFADAAIIDRVIAGTRESGAAVPAVQARDTIKRVDLTRHVVHETLPRQEIWLAQTPQGFQRSVLDDVLALGTGTLDATDEAMLAERAGHPVRVVAGDERNVKITTADDLRSARAAHVSVPRVGTGYDLHRLVEGRPLILAGVVVPFGRGPEAHSDGDVLCHSIIDAILGAASAGDIGQHFPNTDPRWKNAPGLTLLERTVAIVREAGWAVANVDATIVLERPKIMPHVPAMREHLARTLALSIGQVSVKAKTNEGVDATGRGEAIAAHAVAVLGRSGA